MEDFDGLDEITEVALGETRELLQQCEQLLLRLPVGPEELAEVFQRVHTAKSNLAVIPAPKMLSRLLQNLETVLARLRADGKGASSNLGETILRVVQSAIGLVEGGQNEVTRESELEVQRRLNALRLACSAIAARESA